MAESGGNTRPPDSYASSVSLKRHKKLTRNVLNVSLERKGIEPIFFGDQLIGDICEKIGVNVGTQTLGNQVHFTPKKIVVSVMPKPEIGPERFCSQEIKYLSDNLKMVGVKTDNSRGVKISMVGLFFNTPEYLVCEYLEQFGIKLVTTTPQMGIFKDGSWRGQLNGERIYRAEVHGQKCPHGKLPYP